MPRHVFGIVGEIKSGKGLVSDRLQAEYDCDYTRFSIPLGKALDILNLPQTRENLQDVSTLLRSGLAKTPEGAVAGWMRYHLLRNAEDALRSDMLRRALAVFYQTFVWKDVEDCLLQLNAGFGEDILAKTIAKYCETAHKEVVVVDGVRRFADIVMLTKLPEFRLVYVTAPLEVRWRRTVAQAEKAGEGTMSLEEFRRRCEAEPEREIPAVGATAHLRIDNLGTKEDVYRELDAYLLTLDPVAYG